MIPATSQSEAFTAQLECSYLLHVPQGAPELLVLALHGYGSSPEAMLRLTRPLVGDQHVLATLQGPNQHYAAPMPSASTAPAYNWGIREHHAAAVRLHHSMLLTVLRRLRERFGLPASRCVLVGFSQPVGLNYRFIGTHPEEAGGVIGICGGVPRDWEEPKYQAVTAPILHIARHEDEFFPAETARGFPDRLRAHAASVEFHMMPGGHRFPSKAAGIVQPWLTRVFGL
jgi:predicted esterase